MNFIMIYPFFEKFKKLVANLHDKTEYVTHNMQHIRNLKQALNHG